MRKKMEDIKTLDTQECFVDDYKNPQGKYFWSNYKTLNIDDIAKNEMQIYYNYYNKKYQNEKSLPDPDYECKRLYEFHGVLWNRQCENNPNIPSVNICEQSIWLKLNNENITLKSDSFVSIGWHYKKLQDVINKAKEKLDEESIDKEIKLISPELKERRQYDESFSLWKKFIWLYLQKSNTIGGFIVFPSHVNSINQMRGTKAEISDRFDLTLECIRRAYKQNEFIRNSNNPLFGINDQDKEFFNMFGSFENYIDFFFLQDWVDDNYKVKNLLNNEPLDDYSFSESNPLPTETDEWWTFYKNLMDRLDKRNTRIKLSL